MRHQRGNILFLILLAVVLFAALSYAVTSSLRGGGNDASEEEAKALAASILNQLVMTETALNRMMLVKNLRIDQVDFISSPGLNGDGGGCTSTACNLYSPDGGGITPPYLPTKAISPTIVQESCTQYVSAAGLMPFHMVFGVTDVGTTAGDLVLYYCSLRRDVCEQINIAMGLRAKGDPHITSGLSIAADYASWDAVTANNIPSVTANKSSSTDSRVRGHRTFCGESASFGATLFHVIHAR